MLTTVSTVVEVETDRDPAEMDRGDWEELAYDQAGGMPTPTHQAFGDRSVEVGDEWNATNVSRDLPSDLVEVAEWPYP